MHQDRITESSNMLHYSNASSIEKGRQYLVIKGGLAWLLWQERGLVNTVVDQGSNDDSLVVYRREEGGETINIMQTKHQKHKEAIRGPRDDLTRCNTLQTERENICGYLPGFGHLPNGRSGGGDSMFVALEACDGWT